MRDQPSWDVETESDKRYQEIENSGNYVILVGYLNYDLLDEEEIPVNLPLFDSLYLIFPLFAINHPHRIIRI